jgi:hypothetical protein
MWIYRLNVSSPRVYVANRAILVNSDAALDQDELPEFDRTQEALIDEDARALLVGDYVSQLPVQELQAGVSDARIVSYRRNSVSIDVTTDRGGILVLHDIHYPGWEVFVDGERRPLLRANLLFRGVEVGAGRHRVEFHFRPLSLDNLVAAASELVNNGADEVAVSAAE